VHALRRIHECLATDGTLLDVHPQPENSQIEVWQNGEIHRLGVIDQTEDHEEIEAARAHLRSVERDGLFARDHRAFFDLTEHHPTVESWHQRWAENDYRLIATPKLLRSANDLLSSAGGELVIREPVSATTFRRLTGNSEFDVA